MSKCQNCGKVVVSVKTKLEILLTITNSMHTLNVYVSVLRQINLQTVNTQFQNVDFIFSHRLHYLHYAGHPGVHQYTFFIINKV